jgi:hypothetical protein
MSAIREELRSRLDTIESAYEFMLAYAAQGLPSDAGAKSGAQIRTELGRLEVALVGLADAFRALIEEEPDLDAVPAHEAFLEVLADDALKALAAVRLVAAQSAVSSQLVDNLNASIHLRALLTDVFLVDEILVVLGADVPVADVGTDSA